MTTNGAAVENALLEARLERVRRVYQNCWDEYYEWEPQYCREELRKLCSGPVVYDEGVWDDIEEWEDDLGTTEDGDADTVQLYTGQQLTLSEVRVKTVKHEIDFAPVPPYEFCMPISRCISRIDEQEEELEEEEGPDGLPVRRRRVLWIKFCPFTDPDESFPTSQRHHLLSSTKLEWETQPYVDNDVDIIEMETVSRLRDLTFDEIDELCLLPRPIRSMGSELGILRRWHSRDVVMPPHWTAPNNVPCDMLETEFGELNRSFCRICVEFECTRHVGSQQLDVPMPTPKNMIEVDRQCSGDCIVNRRDDEEFIPSQDAVDLLQDLWSNYNALEWTQSCEIAKILAQPCWQVYKVMQKFLEDQQQDREQEPVDHNKVLAKKTLLIIAPDFENYMPYEPCAHSGRCGNDCPCALAGSWCGAGCRCSKLCPRRAQGCSCRDACQTLACPCRRECRECEPGVCGKCWADEDATGCTNNFVLRRESRKTEIRRAEFGWGLFALENISKGDSIITYTGEIYTTDSADARTIVANYLGRNYIFGCGKKIDIDAYAAGNESRVINQSPHGENNCIVEQVWVAGDIHLVVIAKKYIKKGDELFLSYGLNYWTNTEKPREKTKKRRKPLASPAGRL